MTPHHVKRFEDAVEKLERVKWWQWTAIVAIQFITAGGCLGYVQYSRIQDSAEHARDIAELRAISENALSLAKEFRRVLAMAKADPKDFAKIDAQMEAIENYERTRAGHGRSSSGGR